MRRCRLSYGGVVSYAEGLALQAAARQAVAAGEWDGVLLLVEHLPVITIGRSGGAENLLADAAVLRERRIAVVASDRGGNITCHNPGQLVGYPVLNLRRWREDVHWYVEALEEVLIRTLARLGLTAGRKAKYTGVWLGDAKVAAIGVAVRSWITAHGFALNVANDLTIFEWVVPCGIRQFGVTSLAAVGLAVSIDEVAALLATEFAAVFECKLVTVPPSGVIDS